MPGLKKHFSAHSLNAKGQEPRSPTDRISQLPDSLLSSIICLLPTREAVRTCVLSRRWEFVWTEMESLDFDFESPGLFHANSGCPKNRQEEESFCNIIYKALLMTKETSIKNLFLRCGKESRGHLGNWVMTVMRRRIEVLRLDVFNHPAAFSPPSRLTCNTLVVLKLCGDVMINGNSVGFPTLKKLSLVSVLYESEDSIKNLISGCEALEKLRVKRGRQDNVSTFSVCAIGLKHLSLRFKYVNPFPSLEYKLEIDAPALEHLKLHDDRSGYFRFKDLRSLVEAKVHIPSYHSFPIHQQYLSSLEALNCVKVLYLWDQRMDGYDICAVKLQKLSRLVLMMKYCHWSDLQHLLCIADNLDTLTVVGSALYNGEETVVMPKALLSSIRRIALCCFEAKVDELAMVRLFLSNAKVLECMEILTNDTYEVQKNYATVKAILNFPRVCPACEVDFFDGS